MEEQYSIYRECIEKLEQCKKELEKLKSDHQPLQERLYDLEFEKASLEGKI